MGPLQSGRNKQVITLTVVPLVFTVIANKMLTTNFFCRWLAPVIIVGYVLFTPVCIYLAKKNPATEKVRTN